VVWREWLAAHSVSRNRSVASRETNLSGHQRWRPAVFKFTTIINQPNFAGEHGIPQPLEI
jgi:hypothetical protein